MADRRLSAHWAWISKRPGTVDYGIQATSSSQMDFRGYVGQYVTGVPEHETPADAPGSLPWVTFGPFVTPDEQILVSVSIQDPWQDRDSSSRDIFPQRIFLMSYQEVAALGASCRQLWAALAGVDLSQADGGPLIFELPEQPIDDLVATIERYGIERLSALAAMILDDRLVLAGSAALPRDERLAVLDAALALLPYGFRAAVSASSAVNNKVTHVMDLVFAETPNDANKQVKVWLTDAAPYPRTKLGVAYRDMLREKAREPGLRAVVEHLWGATRPCSLQGRQDEALHILAELDFDQSLIRGLHRGTATKAQLHSLLSRDPATVASFWRSQAMTDSTRRAALELLLDGRDDHSSQLLRAHWATVAGDLCALASEDLDAGGTAFATWCLRLSGPGDAEDRFLAGLLASGRAVPGSRPQRLGTLVHLLEAHEVPAPGSMPWTRGQICQDQDETWSFQLFEALLTRQARAGGDLGRAIAWASWLCVPGSAMPPDLPPWATVLRVVCGADTGPGARAVLDPDNPAWIGVLLRLAAFSRQLAATLTFVVDDLVRLAWADAESASKAGRSQGPDPGVRFLLEALDVDLWRNRVPPHVVARADVARVLLGAETRNFPAGFEGGSAIYDYLEGLGYELGPRLTPGWRAKLARRFLDLLVPGGPLSPGTVFLLNNWAANPDLSPEVNRHIAGLDEASRPLDEGLDSSYWDSVAQLRELAGYASVPRLTAAARQAVADEKTALARRTGPTGINNTPLALACHSARRAGLPVREILRVLGAAEASRISPRKLDDLLREFQSLLYYDPELSEDGRDDLFECYKAIARGAFGEQYGRVFAHELAIRNRGDIALRTQLNLWLEESARPGKRALAEPGRLRFRRRPQPS